MRVDRQSRIHRILGYQRAGGDWRCCLASGSVEKENGLACAQGRFSFL